MVRTTTHAVSCDRCKTMNVVVSAHYHLPGWRFLRIFAPEERKVENIDKELCSTCIKQLDKFLRGWPVEGEAKERREEMEQTQ